MPITAKYVFFASMDVDPAHETLFNEVYDQEHIPALLQVPGVTSVTRIKGEPFQMAIGGGIEDRPAPRPVYTAIYEIESPDVVKSDAWAEAVERGRWPGEVRPHTANRAHGIYRVL